MPGCDRKMCECEHSNVVLQTKVGNDDLTLFSHSALAEEDHNSTKKKPTNWFGQETFRATQLDNLCRHTVSVRDGLASKRD